MRLRYNFISVFVLLSVLASSVGAYAQVINPPVPPGKYESPETITASSPIAGVVYSPNPSASAQDSTIFSKVPNQAPRIDGLVSEGEWSDAARYNIPHGTLYVLNDLTALYLMVDLASETDQDAAGSLTLTFDINNNGAIDNGTDVKLGFVLGDDEVCLKEYASPNIWTNCQQTGTIFRSGWGATTGSAVPHRFYEMAVSLAEISPSTALYPRPDLPDIPPALHMGIQVDSSQSAIPSLLPPNHQTDFSQLLKIALDQTDIKLLILGHTDDINALRALDVHKDLTGMPSYLLDWVVTAQLNQSIGYDDPERIKKAIATYEKNWNIEYALLVGDSNRFPIRYTITDREDDNQRADWAFYSADLYFADLYEADLSTFEDWDSNDDHYYGELHGEQITGVVNFDSVDLNPDIAVGRVPASDTSEVSTYVQKVINYEFNAYESEWHKKALMIATADVDANSCNTKETIRNGNLIPEGYVVGELYQEGNTCLETLPPTPANINYYLNLGMGFVNYVGHGGTNGWAIPGSYYSDANLASLTNQNMLPIGFAAACYTGRYTTEPPYNAYTDVNGVEHKGTNAGETFPSKPVQPSPIQANHNLDCFAEEMLVNRSTGGVGYIGCVTGAQAGLSDDLDKSFFATLSWGQDILGDMWKYMVIFYYLMHPDPGSIGTANWGVVAKFHQPWKFHLFGDPSLRIDGVPPIEYDALYLPLVRR
jgi:hypothetical protein